MNNTNRVKEQAIELRKKAMTYGEITRAMHMNIPKSTLSYWFKNIQLSSLQKKKIMQASHYASERGRLLAIAVNRTKREQHLLSIEGKIINIPSTVMKNSDVAKVVVATLYLGEGSKNRRGSLSFGNSNPDIIKLFLRLLRFAYSIEEKKLRCTVQCRADHHVAELERFWSKITNIPLTQFYKTRIDPRTIGKPSKKPLYKGVCRLEYFSADVFYEIIKMGEFICKSP